jgi:hypothetical protein
VGVADGRELAGWATAGVGHPDQLEPWRRLGVTSGRVAARWVRPRLVTGLDEIAAWHDWGITDPHAAREINQTGQLPPGVAEARREGLRRLRGHRPRADGRAALIVRGAGGVTTEVNLYAYGWACDRSVATHWVAADFLESGELPNTRRSGPLVHPNDEPWRGSHDSNHV